MDILSNALKMRRKRAWGSFFALVMMLALSGALFAQHLFAQQSANANKAQTGMLHDLSGVWNFDENGGPGAASNLVPKDVGLTPWGMEKFKANGNRNSGTSSNNCEPLGFLSYPSYPHPIEIVQTPSRIFFFHEVNHLWRTIWMDGRPLPKPEEMPFGPTYLGVSVGRWDGNDLVIETVGLNDKTWVDTTHHPHSEQLHFTERYHRVDQNNLAVTLTFDDPKAYTKTFSWGPKNLHLKSDPAWALGEDFCSPAEQKRFDTNVTKNLNEAK
jgi:hypothetical protein